MGSFKIGGYHVYASALARGAKIGPSQQFQDLRQGDAIEVSYTTFSEGQRLVGKWGGDPKNRYLGVRFSLDGETHFGWIRLTVNTDKVAGMSATITGYAYETVPNKAILAGNAESSSVTSQVDDNYHSTDGPSLGVLALGATGLPVWRRE